MPKVLLISDKKNWSYAAIADGVVKFNDNPDIKLRHISCKGNIEKIKLLAMKYDFYFVIGWQNMKSLTFLDKSRTLVGVHSHQSFDNKKTTPHQDILPSRSDIKYLSQFLGVNTVSLRLHSLLQSSGLSNVYTPNGVDTDIFRPQVRHNGWTACCVAAEKNYWNKGVPNFIAPACRSAGFSLMVLGQNKISNKEMPLFYNKAHVYICASLSEGMPISILEAGACGCVVISTKCGDIVRLIQNGINGFLIDRTIDEIIDSLKRLKQTDYFDNMSIAISKTVNRDWSWKVNACKWVRFIENCLGNHVHD